MWNMFLGVESANMLYWKIEVLFAKVGGHEKAGEGLFCRFVRNKPVVQETLNH